MATIYSITSPDGRKYIGSTTLSLALRFCNHKSDARLNKGNCKLYQAMRQVGDPDAFIIEEITVVPLEMRYQAEGNEIKRLNTHIEGFNHSIPGRDRLAWQREYRRTHPEIIRAQRGRKKQRQAAARQWAQNLNPDEVVIREVINGVIQ